MAAASNEPSRRLPLPKLAAGYELSRFLPDSDASKFFCSICFRVTTSPATLLCQHVFCESCIRNWLLRNYVCPLCRNQAMRYDVRLASGPFLEKLWLLKIRCSFHVVGCPKILALTDVENHERTCLYQVKRCEWKQCKRPLVVENEEDEPSRKKICCDRTCMIQATIEAGQKRITSHDCWNVLEEQAKVCTTRIEAELAMEDFNASITREINDIHSAINKKFRAHFHELPSEFLGRYKLQSTALWSVVQAHAAKIFPSLDYHVHESVKLGDVTNEREFTLRATIKRRYSLTPPMFILDD